jgi:23S rRNA pseudouridine955/2504/2580 synthase/23S rRNA pseudouridine1911/1915/1917 synthase
MSEGVKQLRVPGSRNALDVAYRSDAVIAILKPAGLATIPGRGVDVSLIELMEEALPDDDVRVVHRLDQETSGVILFALGADAQRKLEKQFTERTVHKTYLALARGSPPGDRGVIDLPIGPDAANSERMSIHSRHPREASTEWERLEQLGDFVLLRCMPKTGRTHQIRVHLQASALPLAVDATYGGATELMLSRLKANYRPSRRHEERPLISRVSLHAESITFVDPAAGMERRVEAPLPKDFRATLNQLRKLFGLPADARDTASDEG